MKYQYRSRPKGGTWTAWQATSSPAEWVQDVLKSGRPEFVVRVVDFSGDRTVHWRKAVKHADDTEKEVPDDQ